MRIYDPRIGRFLSVDPLMSEYPWNSTYAYTENNPINYEDIDGLERPATRPMARPSPTRPALSNTYVDANGNLSRVSPIRAGNPPNLMPNEGLSRTVGGYYVSTPNGGFYVPDSKNKIILGRYRAVQERQFDNLAEEAQTARYYFERDINAEKPINATSQLPGLPLPKSPGNSKDNNSEYIFRGGSFTDKNFTPRPGQDDKTGPKSGLSTFRAIFRLLWDKEGNLKC